MTERKTIITVQSDIKNLTKEQEETLISYCKLYSYLERTLFNTLKDKEKPLELSNILQREYIKKYDIHARLFKTLFKQIKGRISSIKSLQKLNKKNTQLQISKTKNKLKKLTNSFKIYNVKNKLNRLKQRLNKEYKVNSVWGSKSFYKKQWNAENKENWLEEWRIKRNYHIRFIGSKTESFGNSLCQLQNLHKLRITLPKYFKDRYLNLEVNFQKNKKIYKYLYSAISNNQALTYKIAYNYKKKKWYVSVSFKLTNECKNYKQGTIGIDLNYNLIALCHVKQDGNKEKFHNIPFELTKDNSNKNTQILSDIANEIVETAKKENKFITIEKLDLKNKLKDKKLNYIVYFKFFTLLRSRAVKKRVLVIAVNPAFTSIIGNLKYKKRFGITGHIAASYVIGRRGLNYIENIPSRIACLLHSGEKEKHNWSKWGILNKRLNEVSQFEKSLCLDYYKHRRSFFDSS